MYSHVNSSDTAQAVVPLTFRQVNDLEQLQYIIIKPFYVGLNQIFSLIRISLLSLTPFVVYVCGQDEVGSPSVFRLSRNILGGVAKL